MGVGLRAHRAGPLGVSSLPRGAGGGAPLWEQLPQQLLGPQGKHGTSGAGTREGMRLRAQRFVGPTCMQPRNPRRTDTLSSDRPPMTTLRIFNPGSWFPICTVFCNEQRLLGGRPTLWARTTLLPQPLRCPLSLCTSGAADCKTWSGLAAAQDPFRATGPGVMRLGVPQYPGPGLTAPAVCAAQHSGVVPCPSAPQRQHPTHSCRSSQLHSKQPQWQVPPAPGQGHR